MKKFLKKFFKVVHTPRCPKCNSTHLNYSDMWNGGWNELCKQAIARSGHRCYDCGHIVWKETDEEYKTNLPEWCRVYKTE